MIYILLKNIRRFFFFCINWSYIIMIIFKEYLKNSDIKDVLERYNLFL